MSESDKTAANIWHKSDVHTKPPKYLVQYPKNKLSK